MKNTDMLAPEFYNEWTGIISAANQAAIESGALLKALEDE